MCCTIGQQAGLDLHCGAFCASFPAGKHGVGRKSIMRISRTISVGLAAVAAIYGGLIAMNMFAWDACWHSVRTQASPPINYLLVVPGVLAQVGHLSAVYLTWRTMDDVAQGKDFDIPDKLSKLLLALLATVAMSGAVRHGMLKGDQGRAYFNEDQCWDFSVAPAPIFH